MNKQVLIDEIKRIHASAIGRSHVSTHPLYSDGVADTCSDVIKLLEQLDEPQNPVVPQFVADWFEEHKGDLEWSIWKLTIDSNANYTKNKKEMRHWIQYAPNKPYKTLIAMLDGYDVEKEPSYCVKIGKGYFSGFDETKVTYVIDDAPESLAQRIKYDSKEEAEMDARQIGGTVEEVVEG